MKTKIVMPRPIGLHRFTNFHPITAMDEWLLRELEKWMGEGKGGMWLPKVQHLITGVEVHKNIIVDAGLTFLAQILCNTAIETDKYITHFAIGTDNTAANAADTVLGTEIFRKVVSSSLDSAKVSNISTFIGATEANATWEEFGHFINGTNDVDTGTMFSHHIQTISKSAPDTKTIDSTYTFADA